MKSSPQIFEDDLSLRLQELALRLLDDLPAPARVKDGTTASIAPTLLLTSARPAEGKTTLALVLARLMARASGESILLVDANFQSPTLATQLGLPASLGFSDALNPGNNADNGSVKAIIHTLDKGVAVMSAGTQNDSILLSRSAAIDHFRQHYTGNYRCVIFDGAIARLGGSMLARHVDGVVMVIDSTVTRREVVQGAIAAMRLPPQRLLGCVLNKRVRHIPNFLYKGL